MLIAERDAFLTLLSDLEPREWAAPTECPAWNVQGIALHVLGDDLSLLSRQRDEAPNGLVFVAADMPGLGFRELLDEFNERWVRTARFFGTPLIVELLRVTGAWTAEFYRRVPADLLGEPVPWVGPEPATYWMIAAREYAERWIHHCQIARAVDRAVPASEHFVVPAVAALMHGFPNAMNVVDTEPGAAVTVAVASHAWTVSRDETGWSLQDGAPDAPTVRVVLSLAEAAGLFSRGLTAEQIRQLRAEGSGDLVGVMTAGLAAVFGAHD